MRVDQAFSVQASRLLSRIDQYNCSTRRQESGPGIAKECATRRRDLGREKTSFSGRLLREMQHLGEVSKTRQSYRTTADNIFRS